MNKSIVFSEAAPKPVASYSQAVRLGDLLFLSGQIAIDPASGDMVTGGVAAETERVLQNLTLVLKAAEATLENVLRATVYLTDMNDFAEFNQIYQRYFTSEPPARATVAVAGLPRGARVEIDAIAHVP
ncbi:MAG TPA: RidA family protein [Polyangiaceae bacterium]